MRTIETATRRRIVAALMTVAIAMTTLCLAPSSAAATAQKLCRVKNTTQDTWFATDSGLALTRALAAARSGDRLNVFGTCRGSFAVQVNLTIAGSTSAESPTTLRGAGTGVILSTSSGTTVRLSHLTLSGNTDGGMFVSEGSTVALVRSKVIDNSTEFAGGGIQNGGDLTISWSRIVGNRTANDGGGIFNYGDLVVNDSVINHNTAAAGGGGLFSEGETVMNRSRVRFNKAASGGGILSVAGLTLNETVVSDNIPDDCACN
jgi:nitrous oxidase accessory protein NosD